MDVPSHFLDYHKWEGVVFIKDQLMVFFWEGVFSKTYLGTFFEGDLVMWSIECSMMGCFLQKKIIIINNNNNNNCWNNLEKLFVLRRLVGSENQKFSFCWKQPTILIWT